MKYHIDTIPVWDAVKLDGECFFCALERRTELGEAERYLGASVMEPDTRVQVNEKGFCPHHHTMLFSMSNRLGHALMLESHTAETIRRLKKPLERLQKASKALAGASLNDKLTGKARAAREDLLAGAAEIKSISDSCIMCETIRENMERYAHTFFHLVKNDVEFRRRFAASKGLCLHHLSVLIPIAAEELNAKELDEFIGCLSDLETANLDRIQEDISWFIKKFDYRYDNESWKNSKDAVERTVNKLRTWCVGKEPNPED